MTNDQIREKASTDNTCGESTHETGRPNLRIDNLPFDVLYTIASKLPPRDYARTSVLSTKWRSMSSFCPRLTFADVLQCKCSTAYFCEHTGRLIHGVNKVLQKHRGKVVETFEVRINLVDNLIVPHLNSWVAFAISSWTKNLTLDLKPKWNCWDYKDRYPFPFELFDVGNIPRIEHMQLSFVSLNPSSQFRGFPYLRKLHLQVLHVSRKDLQHILSHCCNIEWLCIDRCHLNDDLTVDGSLSRLLYLRVEYCQLTKIEFRAVNLVTFEYHGSLIPIDLSHSLKLQSANIQLSKAAFNHAATSLLKGLPSVQNLTLRIRLQHLEKKWLLDSPLTFRCLRNLQLFMFILHEEVDRVLYLVSVLRATPFLEKLEIHFSCYSLWLADVGPCRNEIGLCKYNYLKKICITGFKAAKGQLEFLLHIVENAPALEVVTVNQQSSKEIWSNGGSRPPYEEAEWRTITYLLNKTLPPNLEIYIN